MHVHVSSPDGEAKFRLGPTVALCEVHGMSQRALLETQRVIEKRKDEIVRAWKRHFAS